MWVLAVSIGYFGVKGGAFMVATAGNYIVFGPPATQIEDNNSLALACTTIIPIINYLRIHTRHKLLKLGLTGAMVLTIISVLGSYSRGGLIALAAMLVFLWAKSRTKMLTMMLAVLVGVMGLMFMPQKYADRISTMSNLSADTSFQGRLDAWTVAWRVALDHPLGVGFEGPQQPQVWERYLPEAQPRASHSIYFMVLGEHGFIGLALWSVMLFAAWRALARVQKLTRDRPELLWAKDLAQALQVATIGFMVGGAALPMAYYDGFLSLLAAGVMLRILVQQQLGQKPRAGSGIHHGPMRKAA
jgi:probable O-glycosylation ligase (exosortase A-associated)